MWNFQNFLKNVCMCVDIVIIIFEKSKRKEMKTTCFGTTKPFSINQLIQTNKKQNKQQRQQLQVKQRLQERKPLIENNLNILKDYKTFSHKCFDIFLSVSIQVYFLRFLNFISMVSDKFFKVSNFYITTFLV